MVVFARMQILRPIHYIMTACGEDPVPAHLLQRGNWVCQVLSYSLNLPGKGEQMLRFPLNLGQRVNDGSWNGLMDLCVKSLADVRYVSFLREKNSEQVKHKTGQSL